MTLFEGNLGIWGVWILVVLNSNRRAAPTKKGSSAGAFLFYRSLHWSSFNATVRPDMTKITCARSPQNRGFFLDSNVIKKFPRFKSLAKQSKKLVVFIVCSILNCSTLCNLRIPLSGFKTQKNIILKSDLIFGVKIQTRND